MKISAIESRVIGYDIAEAWGGRMPDAITTTWYEYSFDTFHTDDGVVGYTMQNANLRDGAAMVGVLHDLYAPQVIGEDPLKSEALWHKMRRLNRHAYNLSDGIAGAIDVAVWDIRGKVANLPIATMLGLNREKIPDGFALLDDPTVFQKDSERDGWEPQFAYRVLRSVEGTLKGPKAKKGPRRPSTNDQ